MNHTYFKSIFLATLIPFLGYSQEHYPVNKHVADKKQKECSSKFFTSAFPTSYFPIGMHSLLSVSAAGTSLDIEDGSRWSIPAYSDRVKIAHWSSQDPLIITQNDQWWPLAPTYKIMNHATGEQIRANLQLGPFKNGPYTRYIQTINYQLGEIVLNDLTKWQISILDMDALIDWYISDAVIVGYNTSWDSNCQGLLINVNKNDSIRAAQF